MHKTPHVPCTAWCNEIGSLTSLMHATQVHPVTTENQVHCTRLYTHSFYTSHVHSIIWEKRKKNEGKKHFNEWQISKGKQEKNSALHKHKETRKYTRLVVRLKWHWMIRAWICANAGAVTLACMHVLFKAGPPWFEFLIIFDFFAPWYRRSREASSVKLS